MTGSRVPLADRFWQRVKVSGPDDCWEWQGYRNSGGYGEVGDESHRSAKAHRVAWRLTNGDIPSGLSVCHSCDNPPCCNPSHLWLGTNAENIRDAVSKGRIFASRARGDKNGNAKLSANDVEAIRRRYIPGTHPARRTGASSSELAAEFGITSQYVNQLARGVWRSHG